MDKLNKNQSGFSTIELMIAMAIFVLVLSAVILVSFGNQSFLIGSQTNAEAMKKAQGLIEEEQALARKDFNLVNSKNETIDDIYKKSVTVTLLPDFLTKEVKTTIKWKDEKNQDRNLELTTIISNFDSPSGGDTCNSNPSGDWTSPQIENLGNQNFATLVGDPSGTYTISDLDAYKGKLYVTASLVSSPTKPTFFIFDSSKLVTDPTNALLGKIDNEGSSPAGTVSSGLNAVKVAEDPVTNKIYAYVANAYNANYTSCVPTTTNYCGELEIFDVSVPSTPTLGTNLKILSSPPITGTTYGTSIFYKNGYILLGLSATNGPEFHIIDVHNPASLFGGTHSVSAVGSYESVDGINDIWMRGDYAYIATTNDVTPDQELRILNITSPNSIGLAGGFNTPGGGNGKNIYLIGNRLYLGNTVPNSGNDLHVLDDSHPNTTLSEIAGIDLPSSLNKIIVRSNLAFLLTNTDLRIYDTGDQNSLTPFSIGSPISTLSSFSSGSLTVEPSMDCEANKLYISTNDSTGHGNIYVIKAGS